MRIGIYGGSFNPPHNGHLNSLQTVLKKAGLDKIHVIPSFKSPLKLQVDGPAPEQRLEMVQAALKSYGEVFVVDPIEIERGGKSYTVDTLKSFRKEHAAEDIYLIIGADHFEAFNEWKDWKKILSDCNLVVTTRPGHEIPSSEAELPPYLETLVADYDFNFIELTTGRNIQFITLKDLDFSSSEIRKKLRANRPANTELPLAVESYIKEHKLYRNVGEKISNFKDFTQFCSQALFDKKGINVKAYDLTGQEAPTDFALIASGTSSRHASALAEAVIRSVKDQHQLHPQGIEGMDEGRWIVIDYGALIVHIFYDFVRQEYALENLWRQAKPVSIKDETLPNKI
jgi:nicotinate-nucleotide adenylyltransferase